MKSFRTHQKLLTFLLVGVFFSVPLVTHAIDFSLSGIIIGITGYILWVAAGLFDAALNFFVLKMGALITGVGDTKIGIGVSIDIIWKTVRDLVNLTFIFGLVYVGFKTILNAGTDTKALLSSIIIGALLVNFSLFMSKAVIDVSNITASEIYKAMNIGNGPTVNGKQLSVSETFMSQMGILKLMAPDKNTQAEIVKKFAGGAVGTTDGYLAFVVGASVFILVASFVFAAGAILLAIRFGVLVILMMLSPIFFAATVFPVFRGWRDKWLHSLFSQAFFAPAYLFMIYVTLKVAEGYASQTGGFDKIFTSTTGFANGNFATAIFFCLTIVLMVASLILAKQMGAIGAGRVLSAGKSMANSVRRYTQRRIGGVTLGAVGAVGRSTIGAASSRLAQSQRFQEIAGRSKTGELAIRATRGVAGASFDARTVAGVGAKLGIGEGKKGGFEKKVADKTVTKEAFAATLRTPAAREAYAARQARGLMTSRGSDTALPRFSRVNTIFGTFGRSNRVVASRILNNQLAPLEAQEQTLQNTEARMSQELATLQALPTPTAQQITRMGVLGGPVGVPGTLLYVQNQLHNITTETTRIRGLIAANGLTNRNPAVEIVNPVTGGRRAPRADEQNF